MSDFGFAGISSWWGAESSGFGRVKNSDFGSGGLG
jgi:hypothetical protein